MPESVINQVELNVQNLDHMMKFYQNTLGFQIIEQSEQKIILSADGKSALLSLVKKEGSHLNNPRSPGLYHTAFLLPRRSDLADITQYFIQSQFPLQGASDHHVSEALYLSDPEGNGIEIYIDRPAEDWKWEGDQVYMTTQAMDIEDVLKETSEIGWRGMPAKTIIGHVHLQVANLDSTKKFYCEGLGFDPVLWYGRQALFVSKERYHHHIGLNTWNTAGISISEENTTGLNWFSINLPNKASMDKVIAQLEKINAPFSVEEGQLITTDPSGITIKLLVKE
ncbi:VOC family protein [Pseudogracilibacillus auburnensis]|uniref:VOC family protein n=1 Tax=Pseudogracilibacillus auburnensis TaxID=1494959 RepID=UPI001A9570A0|nr:VOC family protein [Pseudogracilibacillus auburnensis]MBO1003965.1 VOC family protein [Pseudogracilibacillus auburnensis]